MVAIDEQPPHRWTGGQYSLVRVVLAVIVVAWLGDRAWSGWYLFAPMQWVLSGFAIIGTAMGVAVAIGWHDRWAAVGLAVCAAGSALWDGMGLQALEMTPALLPVLHAYVAPAPYGSVRAAGRAQPAGRWRMPRHVQVAAWLLLASVYTVLWLTTLLLGEWASTVQPWRLGQPAALQWLGEPWMRVAAWSLAGSWLVFVPLAIHPRTRPWGWLAVGLVNMVVLPMAGQGLSGAALGALHLFTFDPAWLAPGAPGTRGNRGAGGRRRAPATADIVFYDGLCGLCHRWVRFILAEDWTGQQFVLSPLQGELIDRRLTPQQQDALPDSVVVLTPDDQVLTRSAAVIRLLDRLGGLWRGASWLLWLVPGPLRDLAYDTLAASRTRLFRKPEGLCPVMPPSLRERFVL